MNDSKDRLLLLERMSPEQIKNAVREKYGEVATDPCAGFNFPVGRKFAESVGYPGELLDRLPLEVCESFTGAGNPHPWMDIKPGELVLDLGCGAGLDLILYAEAAGPEGKVWGLDFSEAMVKKAANNMKRAGVKNVELICGSAEAIPLPERSVDIVASNGIYNLAPDKNAVMNEVFRILKPGGRTIFAEIVLAAPLEQETRKSINDWFRCIGGAQTLEEFRRGLEGAGLKEVQVLWTGRNARTRHPAALCAVMKAMKGEEQ